jgi:hypothetical protein
MLLARDVSGFNASQAPMTPAKAKMISMSVEDSAEMLNDLKADFSDLVTKKQAYAYALQWVRANGTGTEEELDKFMKRDIDRWFRSLEGINPDNAKGGRIGGEPTGCLRNTKHWQDTFRNGVANLMHLQEVLKNQAVLEKFAKNGGPNPDKMS